MRQHSFGLAWTAAAIAVTCAFSTTGVAQKGGGGGGGGTPPPGTIFTLEGSSSSFRTAYRMNSDGTAKTALITYAMDWPNDGLASSYGLHNGKRWFLQVAGEGYESGQLAPYFRFHSSMGETRVVTPDLQDIDPYFDNVRWVPGDLEVSLIARRIVGAVWDETHSVLLEGVVTEVGIFAMEVLYDAAGEPYGLSSPYLKVETPRLVSPDGWGDHSSVYSYDWSPSGNALICSGNLTGQQYGSSGTLFAIDAAGLRVIRNSGSYWPAWSPGTTNRIAYSEPINGGNQLCTIGSDGTDRKVVFSPKQTANKKQSTIFPKWSPEGAHLIYLLRNPNDNGIYRVSVTGSGNIKIGDGRPIAWK